MLIWINGPFGIGKTTTARAVRDEARRRGLEARIYDPEIPGFLLQRAIPHRLRPADFREQASWQWATRAAVRLGSLRGLLIVPQTIDDPELLRALTSDRLDRVVQLVAPRSVVEARIRERGIALDWCLDHLATWPDLDALGARVGTVDRNPPDVAADILQIAASEGEASEPSGTVEP